MSLYFFFKIDKAYSLINLLEKKEGIRIDFF